LQPFAAESPVFSPKCSEKTTAYQSMQKLYQLVKYSLINNRNWMPCCERLHSACENDTSDSWRSTANKEFANRKRLDCWRKITVEFPARQWMLFAVLRIIESTGFAKRLSGSDRRRSEWTDSNIKSTNNSNCSQDRQPAQ